jgi:hypothetical protein
MDSKVCPRSLSTAFDKMRKQDPAASGFPMTAGKEGSRQLRPISYMGLPTAVAKRAP